MIALKMLPIIQVIIILCAPSILSYPIYGTKRYGRSSHPNNPLLLEPYQTMIRAQRYPLNYYKLYPFSQNYPDEYYYPQEIVYYPPARTSKYEVYQAVLPYYYQGRPIARAAFNLYAYNNPMTNLQEEMQEVEREEREDAQPIGHEMLYENDEATSTDDNLDDVNAAFLQNLIMSQMYQDAINKEQEYYDQYHYDYDTTGSSYGKWDDRIEYDKPYYQEDTSVTELKQLAKPKAFKTQPTLKEPRDNNLDNHWFQKSSFRNQNPQSQTDKRSKTQQKINQGVVVYANRKTNNEKLITTSQPITSSEVPKPDAGGQKEEVMMRPATPVRHPFTVPVMDMLAKNEVTEKRTPSVYDTIKHMLNMEKSLENLQTSENIRGAMKKRVDSNENSLTRQLTVLKNRNKLDVFTPKIK